MLDGQSLRAARVVVDIGVHCGLPAPAAVGGGAWDYDKAWAFLTANSAMADGFLRFELDRYLGWPGQAPSYKLGERLWLQLRDDAKAAAGAGFDLKEFHRAALDVGSLPLEVLRSAVLAAVTRPVTADDRPGPTLVLASASPARLATLRSAGIEPRVIVADIDEPAVVEEYGGAALAAEDVALLLARRKAEVVAAQVDDALGGGLRLGARAGRRGARQAGRPGRGGGPLAAGCAVAKACSTPGTGWSTPATDDAGGTGLTTGAVASTVVRFSDISDAEIAAYVATGEPLAVAGAFTIDGLGGAFVDGVDGDPHTVVGLSLPLLRRLLAEAEVSLDQPVGLGHRVSQRY